MIIAEAVPSSRLGYMDLRKMYGDRFSHGIAVEVGAGLRPVRHDNVEQQLFCDIRDSEEFIEHFGVSPPYSILTLDEIARSCRQGVDFISSHHVLEHSPNQLATLLGWISILGRDGILYISLPSSNNTTERGRLITPVRHVIEDYFFGRTASSYESKDHIYSFALQLTRSGGEMRPHYADYGVEGFASYLLNDVASRDDHDLHWHTLDLPALKSVTDIAFFLSGRGSEILLEEESEDSLYLICRALPEKSAVPLALEEFIGEITALSECLGRLRA